ncbi:GGDEF domain-containing protein [Agarivorans sp. QJM3NY_33]|uniref:GGDEF domain-containing protein n=1 Tax=Agarivorans sp. QJM3NY_33 TaxID=3421432 RepID=UPI003D7C6BAE
MTIRLRSITFILLILVAIIPVAVLAFTLYQQMYNFAYKSVDSRLAASLKQITAELSHSHQILTNELWLLSEQPRILKSLDNNIPAKELSSFLEHFVLDAPLIESLYLVRNNGQIVVSYAGNGLALSAADNLFDYLPHPPAHEKQPSQRKATLNLADEYALVKRSGKQHSIVHIIPIHTGKNIGIKGYLIAIVPMYRFIETAKKRLEPHENLAIFFRQELLDDDSVAVEQDELFHVAALVLTGGGYQNAVWLKIRVGESLQSLSSRVQNFIAPGVANSTIVIAIILVIVVLFAHFVAKSFGQLYTLIKDFETDKEAYWFNCSKFSIREFTDVSHLLVEMKRTIGEQLRTVNHKNKELARIDQLRAGYLEEVQTLNSQLEFKVEERTRDLELSMADLAQSHFFFQQLVQFRRSLEASSGNKQIVHDALLALAACFPDIEIVLHLPASGKHSQVTDSLSVSVASFEDIKLQASEALKPNVERTVIEFEQQWVNLFAISCGSKKEGWLLVNHSSLSEQVYNRLLLVITELSSFLENRSLHEELDTIARTDSLTGISNRKAFDELQFTLETQLDAEVGLFVIDVNGLKKMNDEKGHEKGDQLIISVARVLRECCDGITDNYFRIGGDEFAVVLSGVQLTMAEVLLKRLRSQQNNRVFIDLDSFGGEPLVSFSVGYATTEVVQFSGLYRLADQNMYHDKQSYYLRLRQTEL